MEKHQRSRNHILSIRDSIHELPVSEDDVLLGGMSRLFLLRDYLLIASYSTTDRLIHIFDRKDFRYLCSTGTPGPGPKEITMMGHVGTDEARNSFYVLDHGKLKIYAFQMDRVLSDSMYVPEVRDDLSKSRFPDRFQYVSDTLSYALMIQPTSASTYKQAVARWNMNTGEFFPMPYENPDITTKKICFAVSPSDSLYAECYLYYDLMTICHLDGTLKCNIYGPHWTDQDTNRTHYFGGVIFCKDKIVASYSGGNTFTDEYFPTQLLVFDLDGNYLRTLDVGCPIMYFCYDEKYDRILMSLDDVMQFAYFSTNGII